MARFSFGGAQDLSGIFADMYRIGDAQAARERNAEDQNVINKWETGEMSDAEFYAYAQERIKASAGDPEERSQWEQILRNAKQTNEGEAIEDTAEDIMDGIEAGTRSWDDLLNYYKAARKKLKPSDPLYRELSQQIDQVEDRKRDNEVAATYGSIDYRYRSGQISGAQAEKEMRALAERYRKNDPQKYYELLGQGLGYKQADAAAAAGGGSGGGGGRRSGGGSGGSKKDTSLKDSIDQLKGFEDRLLSLSRQARDGQRIGSITVPGEDGVPTTEQIVLLNKDGSVTKELRGVHEQTLLVYDELEKALIADGKMGEAGSIAGRRATFITDYVQPANTIKPERQWERLVSDFVSVVQGADAAASPALAWRDIQNQAKRLAYWGSRLNTRTTTSELPSNVRRSTDPRALDGEETGRRSTKTVVGEEGDPLLRLSPTFTDEVIPQIEAIMAAVESDDPAAIVAAFENLPEGSPLADAAPMMAQIRVIQAGLVDGSWAYAMHPDLGVIPVEMSREQTGLGPDGNPVIRTLPMLLDANGNLIYDPNTAEPTEIMAKVGGEYQPVLAMSQKQMVATSTFTYDGITVRRGQEIPPELIESLEAAPEGTPLPPIGEMRAVRAQDSTWYGLDRPDGKVGWFKDRVPKSEQFTTGAPMPFTGGWRDAFHKFADMGLSERPDPIQYNPVGGGTEPKQNRRFVLDNERQTPLARQRLVDDRLAAATGGGRSRGGSFGPDEDGPLSNILQIGKSLGLRGMGERPARSNISGGRLATRRTHNIDMPNVVRPNIRPVNIARPNVSRPNVNVAGLQAMAARLKSLAASNATRFRNTSLGRSGRPTTPNIGRRIEPI